MAIVTMTQALKKLHRAVVGEDTTKNNPTKIVSDLADNYSGGGGGGAAEPLIVNRTYNSDIDDYTYGDTTFGEVRQAFESGRPVIIRTDEDGTTRVDLVYEVSYTISELGDCSGSVRWIDAITGVSGDDSIHTLEEIDAIVLGTSLA